MSKKLNKGYMLFNPLYHSFTLQINPHNVHYKSMTMEEELQLPTSPPPGVVLP